MAEAPDDPLIDPDIPERRRREEGTGRRQGIPEAKGAKRKDPMIRDLSSKKSGFSGFKTAERLEEQRNLEAMDLDWEEGDRQPASSPQPPTEKEISSQAVVPSPDHPEHAGWHRTGGPESRTRPISELPPADEIAATTGPESVEDPNATAREDLPGAALEEAQRKPPPAPKTLRPTDFEPRCWASGSTRYDWPDDDGKTPVGWKECLAKPLTRAKGFCKRSSAFEVASMSLVLLVVVASFVFFRSLVHSKEQVDMLPTSESLELPIKGDGLTMTSVESFWRPVQPGDIAKPGQFLLPQVNLGVSGSGFIRVFFREPPEKGEARGRIRGDSLTLDASTGGVQSVTCSEGYESPMDLIEYKAGQAEGWQVEIFQSKAANAPFPDAWQLFTQFLMSANREGER